MLRLLTCLLLAALAAAKRVHFRRVQTEGQQAPGDVGVVTGVTDDLIGSVGEDIATATGELQGATAAATEPLVTDPQSALENAAGSVEGTLQEIDKGEGVLSDAMQPQAIVETTQSSTTQPKPSYPAAPFNGVFCRGAACQYRYVSTTPEGTGVSKPVWDSDALVEKSSDSVRSNDLVFCRGLGCPPSGQPDPEKVQFLRKCMHLLEGYGHDLQGDDDSRLIIDVRRSFLKVCRLRVDFREAENCVDYGDVIVAALSPLVDNPTVGTAREVCATTLTFVRLFKQAEVDFRLYGRLSQAYDGDQQPAAKNASAAGGDTPKAAGNNASAAGGDVEIAPGSKDGVLKPVRVSQQLLTACTDKVEHATGGDNFAAVPTVKMIREWCAMQTIITSYDQVKGDVHPEWTAESCAGFVQFFAFALRKDLGTQKNTTAPDVCKRLFLASGAVHGFDRLVGDALLPTTRGLPPLGLALPIGDPDMENLAEKTKENAEGVLQTIERHSEVAEALKAAKEEVAAHIAAQVKADAKE